jgi:hypothetical protein
LKPRGRRTFVINMVLKYPEPKVLKKVKCTICERKMIVRAVDYEHGEHLFCGYCKTYNQDKINEFLHRS